MTPKGFQILVVLWTILGLSGTFLEAVENYWMNYWMSAWNSHCSWGLAASVVDREGRLAGRDSDSIPARLIDCGWTGSVWLAYDSKGLPKIFSCQVFVCWFFRSGWTILGLIVEWPKQAILELSWAISEWS